MSTAVRFLVFGVFAAAGVALAVALATHLAPPEKHTVAHSGAPVKHPQRRPPAHAEAPPAPRPVLMAAEKSVNQPPATGGLPNSGTNPQEFLQHASTLLNAIGQVAPGALPPGAVPPAPGAAPAAPASTSIVPPPPKTTITEIQGEGDGQLSITIQGEDIRKVLELLSEQGGLNILCSNSVTGDVSASLKNVDLSTALDAILKSTGFVWRREGNFIYVGTPKDFTAMEQAADRIGTRLYRPNYVTSADLQTLITPLLTAGVGTISVNVASEVGIPADANNAGGNAFAGQEAVLVRDYEAVLIQIDEVVAQLDRQPLQVSIEAMVLSVLLDDTNKLGVDFGLFANHIRVTSGSPLDNLASMTVDQGGLKVGFVDGDVAAFVHALETVGDTNVIATPRVMCLNKHRAEILIGSMLGYVSTTQTETSTTQSVEFLEVGTQLRLRPFISTDGLIRMEVHPELSTGNVKIEGGFTLPNKEVTQVTTNVMVRDGCTVIIGGLLRDELKTNTSQIPYLGSMPVVGPVFRTTNEKTERREILVLLTPRIVYEPMTSAEGNKAAAEFHHRHLNYADQMSVLGKRYVGRKYFRHAQQAWAAGDAAEALRLVNLSLHFDPINRAALDLRNDIALGKPVGDHTIDELPDSEILPNPHPDMLPLEEEEGMMPEWMLDQLGEPALPPSGPLSQRPAKPAGKTPVKQ